MSINFKTIKKPKTDNKMKGQSPDSFVVAVTACTYQNGSNRGGDTGNYEIVIKTPKKQGDKEMREELGTVCLENYPSPFHADWGGSHFRLITYKQYEVIIETLKGLPYGDSLTCMEVPASFKTKPAPILKLHYDASREAYTLTERVYNLKYYLGLIGFKWRAGRRSEKGASGRLG